MNSKMYLLFLIPDKKGYMISKIFQGKFPISFGISYLQHNSTSGVEMFDNFIYYFYSSSCQIVMKNDRNETKKRPFTRIFSCAPSWQ